MLILTSYPELENDRWTVETSFIFNVNFYNQISFEKIVALSLYLFNYYILFILPLTELQESSF